MDRHHHHRRYDPTVDLFYAPPPPPVDNVHSTMVPVFSRLQHTDKVASSNMKPAATAPPTAAAAATADLPGSVNRTFISRPASFKPYPKGRPSPRKGSPRKPKVRLDVGGELPVLSPEQQTRLQNELFPGRNEPFMQSGVTIAQLREMSKLEGQAQTDAARLHTAVALHKRRLGPPVPTPITAEQRARGRLLRYISLYENEYREDILQYMYKLQDGSMPSRSAMEQQTDIDMSMRAALVDFMVELHAVFHLRQETLYLGINVLDRYTSRRVINKKHYQLIGCTSMWIAAKFEDSKDHVPTTGDLKQYCQDVYEERAFQQMEIHVLDTIGWDLGHCTAEAWFRCLVNTLDHTNSEDAKQMAIRQGWVGLPELETHGVPIIKADLQTQCTGRFLMEIMTYQASLLDVPPCVIAEAGLILAKVINWKARERVAESAAALHVARYLHDLLSKDLGMISTALFNKYNTSQFMEVAKTVNDFYAPGKDEEKEQNCLKYLEGLPDVEEVAAQREAERIAAEEEAAESAAFGEDLEEVDVTSDDPVALSFSDSGYGSVVGGDSPSAGKMSKDAPAASGPSGYLSPPPSSTSSPRKACPLPDGIPPLNLSPSHASSS